jgi:hypothetical protein
MNFETAARFYRRKQRERRTRGLREVLDFAKGTRLVKDLAASDPDSIPSLLVPFAGFCDIQLLFQDEVNEGGKT